MSQNLDFTAIPLSLSILEINVIISIKHSLVIIGFSTTYSLFIYLTPSLLNILFHNFTHQTENI